MNDELLQCQFEQEECCESVGVSNDIVFIIIILGWTTFLATILGMNNNTYALCQKYNSAQISKFIMNV